MPRSKHSRHARRSKSKTRRKPQARPQGVFEGNAGGYGFVKTAEGEFFIPAKYTLAAFDGDLVEVAPMGKGGSEHGKGHGRGSERSRKHEARITRILEHVHATLVGRYEVAGPFGVVVPDDARINHDIFTLRKNDPNVEDGSIVRVRILEYPTRRSSATGVIEEVLGRDGDASLSVERIIARLDLETSFSENALAEAKNATLDVAGALAEGYRDIRDRFVFTIDPADAKDFDDALSLDRIGGEKGAEREGHHSGKPCKERPAPVFLAGKEIGEQDVGTGNVWRLGVHIADVSHYVAWGSSIDLDARGRATSVYLADRVIPMLPEELSNELCSLKPHEDRLCMTADLYVDDEANLLAYDLYPAIMRSQKRLSYDEALLYIEDARRGTLAVSKEKQLVERLVKASALAKARERYREAHGGIEFSTKEAKVTLDHEGYPTGIVVREKNDATQLIEEAMIFANEVVAAHLAARDWPCAYRVHERPAEDALSALIPVLQEFPWFKKKQAERLVAGDPHTIQAILDECEGRPEFEMITMLFLRAMMRAEYSPKNFGHYGLGLSAYCHFTSPIRRYPDLIVHRMLRAQLTKRSERFGQEVSSLKWLCEHSSEMERKAEMASYDSQRAKIVEYMEQFVGQRFQAIISGVMNYGLYVRLDNCAEGLVPVRTLGDEYFIYDPVRNILRGSDSDLTYRLGQTVDVQLTSADIQAARLDFVIV